MAYIYYYEYIWDSTDRLIKGNCPEIIFALKFSALSVHSVILNVLYFTLSYKNQLFFFKDICIVQLHCDTNLQNLMICYLEPDKTQVKNNKCNYQNSKQKATNIRVKKDNYNYL